MENRLPTDNDQAYIDADLQYVSDLFLGERIRQKRDLRYTDDSPEFKEYWKNGELGDAAAWYALDATTRANVGIEENLWPLNWWPTAGKHSPECRMRELVKAGGLLLHEAVRVFRSRFDDVPRIEPDGQNYEVWYNALTLAGIRDMHQPNFLEQIEPTAIGEEYASGNDPVEAYRNLMLE